MIQILIVLCHFAWRLNYMLGKSLGEGGERRLKTEERRSSLASLVWRFRLD